jgi:hypothetical protein
MPRRRRGTIKVDAKSKVVVKQRAERGLLMRTVLHSPKDTIAATLAFAAVVAIVVNALFFQAGHHPSPMFGAAVPLPLPVALSASTSANVLPRPRPAEADSVRGDVRTAETGSIEVRDSAPAKVVSVSHGTTAKPPAGNAATRNDPLGDLIVSSRRAANVQRALTKYGYGQLKPTGTIGPDTQAAIQKFERERKLPVTGQISDRLVRELSVVTGQVID